MTNKSYDLTNKLPRQGQDVIVTGAHLGGSFTPYDEGVSATYIGIDRGYAVFQGRTADYGYVGDRSGVTWRAK